MPPPADSIGARWRCGPMTSRRRKNSAPCLLEMGEPMPVNPSIAPRRGQPRQLAGPAIIHSLPPRQAAFSAAECGYKFLQKT